MTELTARTIATVSIWFAFTIVLTFGVLDFKWGDGFLLFFIVLTICLAAVCATAIVWGCRLPRSWLS